MLCSTSYRIRSAAVMNVEEMLDKTIEEGRHQSVLIDF